MPSTLKTTVLLVAVIGIVKWPFGLCCYYWAMTKWQQFFTVSRFSGITRKMLKHVHTRIEEVQHQLQQLLPSDAILVGHSLNFDLDALQVPILLTLIFCFWLVVFQKLLLSHIMCTECKDVACCYWCSVVCVCLLDIIMSCAKMDELIEMPFGDLGWNEEQCIRCRLRSSIFLFFGGAAMWRFIRILRSLVTSWKNV